MEVSFGISPSHDHPLTFYDSKHMDKHDRPYKCHEPGCDKIQGFTYSGGLLRHQREVHKKNQSARQELYCPYPNCNRSTEQPFTRQENLKEHVRRRHVTEGVTTSPGVLSAIATPAPLARTPERSRKRKRTSSIDFDDELQFRTEDTDEEDPVQELKRLRREVDEKTRKIHQLEAELARIKQQVPSLGPLLGP
jgi:Zinc finger, C2H2 type